MRVKRAVLSKSPLARPKSPIHALASRFQNYLHFPDPSPLYAVMGAVAANMMTGHTVWLMLVGPSSCGKSELLTSLLGIPGIHPVDSISSPGALLSGTGKKDRAKDATGGLLRQIGDRGLIVMKDFTSVLSMPVDGMKQILGAFREIYDGRWTRNVGSDGARILQWQGRIGMLGGVTPVIDNHHSIIASMGERWIFYRYRDSDGFGESTVALSQKDPDQARLDIQEFVREFFDALHLNWQCGFIRRDLQVRERQRIISIAALSARCRSPVVRNTYTRQVDDIPVAESPTRLATVLGQLYLGLELIGLEEQERNKVIQRIALDCMPQGRRRVLDLATTLNGNGNGGWFSINQAQLDTKVSPSTVRRLIEDLAIHDVLETGKASVGKDKLYRLSEWAKTELENGYE